MRKRNKRNYRYFYIFGLIIILTICILWWFKGIQAVNRNSTNFQNFTIEKGASLRDIATNLKTSGLIRDSYTFIFAVKILGIDNSIQAGKFELSPNMNTISIAKKLTRSTTDIRVTLPEGKRAEEIADIISKNISSLNKDTLSQSLIEHNGYLFPDTYNFENGVSNESIIRIMRENFERKYETISPSIKFSKEEIVIIASMIEREARHNEDRPLVASVIYNRLNIGMKLDIDATVQYALGFDKYSNNWWKRSLTRNDLTIDSPYNTYTNAGLPPTPISNPGLASLTAAANPASSDYFFYFTDKDGINRYSQTLDEQNANIRKFGL